MDYRESAQKARKVGENTTRLSAISRWNSCRVPTSKGTNCVQGKDGRTRVRIRGTQKKRKREGSIEAAERFAERAKMIGTKGERVKACIGNVIATTADFQTMRGE